MYIVAIDNTINSTVIFFKINRTAAFLAVFSVTRDNGIGCLHWCIIGGVRASCRTRLTTACAEEVVRSRSPLL